MVPVLVAKDNTKQSVAASTNGRPAAHAREFIGSSRRASKRTTDRPAAPAFLFSDQISLSIADVICNDPVDQHRR